MPSKPPPTSDIFNCIQCGDCCKGYGGTYVTEADIEAIATYIQKTPEIVRTQFCQMSGSRPLLKQREDGFCVFHDQLCTIHPVKPRMCRAWPFIESVLIDANNWQMMGSCCPGIRTDQPAETVQACVAAQLQQERGSAPQED